MKKTLLYIMLSMACTQVVSAEQQPADTVSVHDSLSLSAPSCDTVVSPRPWRALAEMIATNGVINLFGRYVMNEAFAKTTLNSIRHNLKSGFAWDDDNFYVNNVGHVYQGGLYFNAARVNGMGFWKSIPYTFVGSLSWELFSETEQPSINDMIITTLTGTMVGEVSYRLTPHLIDERVRGGKRFLREAVAGFINPIEGFHRLFSGRLWKVRATNEDEYACRDNSDVIATMGVGARCVWASGAFRGGAWQPVLSFDVEYGQTADGERHLTPYDFFDLNIRFAFGRKQHLASHLDLIGRLCSTPAMTGKKARGELGLYQFFHYEDTRIPGDSTKSVFPFGEMTSVGPGLLLSFPKLVPRISMDQRLYLKGVLLGAVNSDYYHFYNRTYNMGSGWGALSSSRLTWENVGIMNLRLHYMHLFTWKGYEPGSLPESVFDTNYLNVLGDKSEARVFSVQLHGKANLSKSMRLLLGASYYSRHTHYRYHPNQQAESFEMRAGVEWCL